MIEGKKETVEKKVFTSKTHFFEKWREFS